jgi:hypothetical protein
MIQIFCSPLSFLLFLSKHSTYTHTHCLLSLGLFFTESFFKRTLSVCLC